MAFAERVKVFKEGIEVYCAIKGEDCKYYPICIKIIKVGRGIAIVKYPNGSTGECSINSRRVSLTFEESKRMCSILNDVICAK